MIRHILISSFCLWKTLHILGSSEFDARSQIEKDCHHMVGVYWGAFDPPTVAHEAILCAASKQLKFKRILVIVNNHSYKTYTNPLNKRMELIRDIIVSNHLEDIVLLSQDDSNPMDYSTIKKIVNAPLCAISGYDAYCSWVVRSTSEERAQYSAIAIVPRGNQTSILSDSHAFLLPIHPDYKDVSSTAVRGHSSLNERSSSRACAERRISER